MNLKNIALIIALIIIGSIISFLLSQDKPTTALTIFALALASLTLLQSVLVAEKSSEQTERALRIAETTANETQKQNEKILKLTEITLEKTEIERKMRDIRGQLDLFYYPLYDLLLHGPSSSQWQRDIFDKIGFHRYLATKEIIKKFEGFQRSNYSHGYEPCNKLTESLKIEVNFLEIAYNNLKNEFKALETEYKQLKDSN